MTRFSKARLIDDLAHRMEVLERDFRFDPRTGAAQITSLTRDPLSRAIEYGRYSMLQDLIDELSE